MKITNENFIKRFKKHKEDALEYVIDQYLGIVKAIIYNALKSYADQQVIDECINDTFLGAWENAKQFEGSKDDFRKWICTIAKFKAVDAQRKLARNPFVTDINTIQMNTVQSAEEELVIKESMKELLLMMSQLDNRDRDIFTMKYFLNMKNEEIANHLGVTKASVDNRLYRGKKRLQQIRLGGSFS